MSTIAALSQKRLRAPLTFEGVCNHQVFEKWLGEMLMPCLLPGQTVIRDNATFHKLEKIRELMELAGCELQYLPSYSLDLHEIEHFWFAIKHRVRKMVGNSLPF